MAGAMEGAGGAGWYEWAGAAGAVLAGAGAERAGAEDLELERLEERLGNVFYKRRVKTTKRMFAKCDDDVLYNETTI